MRIRLILEFRVQQLGEMLVAREALKDRESILIKVGLCVRSD